MHSTIKKATRRTTRTSMTSLHVQLEKIQSAWRMSDRQERAVLAQTRLIQLCKLAGIQGS